MSPEKVTSFPVHKHADRYPMMSDEKLEALAVDIKAPRDGKQTGQLHPVIVRKVGDSYELIDGRNRLEACKRAGVMVRVTIEELTDAEAVQLIVSLNDKRRQLNARQQAEAAYNYWIEMCKSPATKITQAHAAKEMGVALRTFQKWKPGSTEANESDAKKGNNNNRYPISSTYRKQAHWLSKLLVKGVYQHIEYADAQKILKDIERLYKLEFQGATQ